MKSRKDISLSATFVLTLTLVVLCSQMIYAQAPDSLWMFHYGGTDKEMGFDAIEGSPGEYYLVGKTRSFSNGGYDAYILKLDDNGGIIWEKHYGDQLDEQIVSICPALYGGHVMTGYTQTNENSAEVWYLWIDEDGDTIWTRTYGGAVAQNCYAMHQKDNGNYVLCGYTSSFSPYNDVYMLEIDPQGNMIWEDNWGVAGGDEYMYGCRPTSDGGYIITGWTNYYGAWNDELFALKLGESSGLEEAAKSNSIISVNPNSCQSNTTIHLENALQIRSALKAYNSLCHCVHTFFVNAEIMGRTVVEWETDHLDKGIYFSSLSNIVNSKLDLY